MAPLAPAGEMRVGGFGGADGLAKYLKTEAIDLLVNATHPFAAEISRNALDAHHRTGVPLLRLMRPPWERQAGDHWVMVADAKDAAAQCRQRGGNIFLTVGSRELGAFRDIPRARFLARAIATPDPSPLPGCAFIEARGPFDLGSELDLMRQFKVDLLVAKSSGGEATRAKIDAARELGLPVLMIERPPIAREPGCETRPEVQGALDWIGEQVAARGGAN